MKKYLITVTYVVEADSKRLAEFKVDNLVAYGKEETAHTIPPDFVQITISTPLKVGP